MQKYLEQDISTLGAGGPFLIPGTKYPDFSTMG